MATARLSVWQLDSIMISDVHRSVLKEIHGRLQDLGHPWAITGSLGFALQGLEVGVHDVDIQTDREGAYRIEDRFRSETRKEVQFCESEHIRSYFGELKILGTRVEIMGALQKRLPSGEWESPVEVERHRHFVQYDGMKVPVLLLEYEETAYRLLGRNEKADVIRKWLKDRSGGPDSRGPRR